VAQLTREPNSNLLDHKAHFTPTRIPPGRIRGLHLQPIPARCQFLDCDFSGLPERGALFIVAEYPFLLFTQLAGGHRHWLLEAEFEQSFAGDLQLLALLGSGNRGSGSSTSACANGRALSSSRMVT
jgi:hypothetical protein